VYTPLHGVGDALVRRALSEARFTNVASVPEQERPDGSFPTVDFPNPEEPGTLDLSFALAKRTGAALILANDPDADRLAVAIPEDQGYRQLTGNEVGALLGHYLLVDRPPYARSARRAVLASIVSSPLLGRIARELGVYYEETLTGFKWIANRAIDLEREGYEFVFGYEEALGYCAGSVVRDKDGISAALLVAELAAVLRASGRTLADELDAIARRWGVFASTQVNLTQEGLSGAAAIRAMMDALRASPPRSIAQDEVISIADYETGNRFETRTARSAPLTLPRSNVLALELASGGRIIARPSGTEPKAKFYFDVWREVRSGETVRDAAARARVAMTRLQGAFMALIAPP
jgi:phosphomannomutase